MRTVFKILLVSVWLLLAVLKLAFRLAAGAAAFVLAIGGGLLLVYDLFLLIIGSGSRELVFQLLVITALILTSMNSSITSKALFQRRSPTRIRRQSKGSMTPLMSMTTMMYRKMLLPFTKRRSTV